jgi:hypothetical protein
LVFGLLNSGKQHAGEGVQGQRIGAGCEDQFAQLCFLSVLKGFGAVLERLDLGIDVEWLAHESPPSEDEARLTDPAGDVSSGVERSVLRARLYVAAQHRTG